VGETMNALLGSKYETSLRILLLLEAAQGETLPEGAITALDYITVYAHDFGLSDVNLHGENKYRFGEYAFRRTTTKNAIKQLVLDGLVDVIASERGFHYKLSSDGYNYVGDFCSEYADAYYETATRIIDRIGTSELVLSGMINNLTISSIQEA
jgi:hypothetical protein